MNNCNLFKSEAEWQKIRTFPTKLQDVCLPFSSCITDLFPQKKEKKRKTSLSYCYCAECRRSTGSDSHCLLFPSFRPVFPAAVASIPPCQKRCKKKSNTTKTKKQKSTVGSSLTSEIIFQLLREPPLRCQCESK